MHAPSNPASKTAPTPPRDFSLTALLLTLAVFVLVDGVLVAMFAAHEHSLSAGILMFVVSGGPLGLAFGSRVYRRIERLLTE